MSRPLELDPEPRSVRLARAWIVDELGRIGREDLADSAALAVSELVTNAILHAEPPIVVRLAGTPAHPRVEVHDRSQAPPSVRDLSDDSRLLATVGRGLSIVSMYSTTWGAEVSPSGKMVWFEPAVEPGQPSTDGPPRLGDLYALSEPGDAALGAAPDGDGRVSIRLLGMPVRLFAHYRVWYEELRRELRLLSMNHGEEYPVAAELSALALSVEQERRQVRGLDALNEAIASGADRVDLEYRVQASAPATMARLRELLERVDDFCRDQWLLTLAPSPQQLELRTWYLSEFERQARGEPPRPWTGSYVVEDHRG